MPITCATGIATPKLSLRSASRLAHGVARWLRQRDGTQRLQRCIVPISGVRRSDFAIDLMPERAQHVRQQPGECGLPRRRRADSRPTGFPCLRDDEQGYQDEFGNPPASRRRHRARSTPRDSGSLQATPAEGPWREGVIWGSPRGSIARWINSYSMVSYLDLNKVCDSILQQYACQHGRRACVPPTRAISAIPDVTFNTKRRYLRTHASPFPHQRKPAALSMIVPPIRFLWPLFLSGQLDGSWL